MKKIALFFLLLSSLYAEAKFYTGASYGYLNEDFEQDNAKANEVDVLKIKVGYGEREAYAAEFSLDYSEADSQYLSTNVAQRYAMGIDLVKGFDYDIYIIPFFKAGIGTGYLDSSDHGKITFGSFKVGAGTLIPLNEHFDFELGYEYKYISYEKISDDRNSDRSDVNIIYAGFNVRF
ncbi:MAG: outer membrane beta-barrel protein [Sulfurimonas sp.]|nr:outer membrane beta-barrel protein [Sulfurimonas sp.]